MRLCSCTCCPFVAWSCLCKARAGEQPAISRPIDLQCAGQTCAFILTSVRSTAQRRPSCSAWLRPWLTGTSEQTTSLEVQSMDMTPACWMDGYAASMWASLAAAGAASQPGSWASLGRSALSTTAARVFSTSVHACTCHTTHPLRFSRRPDSFALWFSHLHHFWFQ